jgi:hypothetical protein
MSELVRSLSEDELFSPNRYQWREGRPLANVVEFDHFHEEHEQALRRWLAEQEQRQT